MKEVGLMRIVELKNNKVIKKYEHPKEINGLDGKRLMELIHKLNSSAGAVVAVNMGSRTRYFKANIDRMQKKSNKTFKVDVTTDTDFYYCNYQKAESVIKFNKDWGIEILHGTKVQSNHSMFSYIRSNDPRHQHGLRFVSKKTWLRMPKTHAGWGFRPIEKPCSYIQAIKEILPFTKYAFYCDDACVMLVFDTKDFSDMFKIVQEHTPVFYFVSKEYQHEDYNRVFLTPQPYWSPEHEVDEKNLHLERIVAQLKQLKLESMGI